MSEMEPAAPPEAPSESPAEAPVEAPAEAPVEAPAEAETKENSDSQGTASPTSEISITRTLSNIPQGLQQADGSLPKPYYFDDDGFLRHFQTDTTVDMDSAIKGDLGPQVRSR